jgi:hypothetical protein
MSWARVDDGFWCHPKVVGISFAARGVWISALSWCAQFGTDGFIVRGSARALEFPVEAIDELVAEGLWEETPRGYQIHDYLKYNPSKAEVEARREFERVKKARTRSRAQNIPHVPTVPKGQTRDKPGDNGGGHRDRDLGSSSSLRSETSEELKRPPPREPELKPPAFTRPEPAVVPAPEPALRAWKISLEARQLDPSRRQHPGRELAVCQAIARWAGPTLGPEWDRDVRGLLDAWLADKRVREQNLPLFFLMDRDSREILTEYETIWRREKAKQDTKRKAIAEKPPEDPNGFEALWRKAHSKAASRERLAAMGLRFLDDEDPNGKTENVSSENDHIEPHRTAGRDGSATGDRLLCADGGAGTSGTYTRPRAAS